MLYFYIFIIFYYKMGKSCHDCNGCQYPVIIPQGCPARGNNFSGSWRVTVERHAVRTQGQGPNGGAPPVIEDTNAVLPSPYVITQNGNRVTLFYESGFEPWRTGSVYPTYDNCGKIINYTLEINGQFNVTFDPPLAENKTEWVVLIATPYQWDAQGNPTALKFVRYNNYTILVENDPNPLYNGFWNESVTGTMTKISS